MLLLAVANPMMSEQHHCETPTNQRAAPKAMAGDRRQLSAFRLHLADGELLTPCNRLAAVSRHALGALTSFGAQAGPVLHTCARTLLACLAVILALSACSRTDTPQEAAQPLWAEIEPPDGALVRGSEA
jgi:hypothetical protein